jgi:hypothetical protein
MQKKVRVAARMRSPDAPPSTSPPPLSTMTTMMPIGAEQRNDDVNRGDRLFDRFVVEILFRSNRFLVLDVLHPLVVVLHDASFGIALSHPSASLYPVDVVVRIHSIIDRFSIVTLGLLCQPTVDSKQVTQRPTLPSTSTSTSHALRLDASPALLMLLLAIADGNLRETPLVRRSWRFCFVRSAAIE